MTKCVISFRGKGHRTLMPVALRVKAKNRAKKCCRNHYWFQLAIRFNEVTIVTTRCFVVCGLVLSLFVCP